MRRFADGSGNGFTYRWVSIWAASFGILEAIVVIYLRLLYYPDGFQFPLILAPVKVYPVEVIREISTLIMLAATGMLAGKNGEQRFAWFLFAFGIWDISFYLALRILMGWPSSLFTWDLLFLVPVIWTGPVLAPLICSVNMIGFAVTVTEASRRGRKIVIRDSEWSVMAAGASFMFIPFIWDSSVILIRTGFFSGTWLAATWRVIGEMLEYIPEKFNWPLFIAGEVLVVSTIVVFGRRGLGNFNRNNHLENA